MLKNVLLHIILIFITKGDVYIFVGSALNCKCTSDYTLCHRVVKQIGP